MSYTYHGTNGIIALPGRSVQTFPSGLVRVDRTYAVRADRADAARREFAVGGILPLDDGTPAIDGLYIFPEPQETSRDDGFVEFQVSGYGRTNISGYSRREFVQGETNITRISQTSEGTTTTNSVLRTLNESVVETFVQIADQPFLLNIGIPNNSLKVYFGNGKELQEVYPSGYTQFTNGYSIVTTQTIAQFAGTSTNNFGRWSEITITYTARGGVLIQSSAN